MFPALLCHLLTHMIGAKDLTAHQQYGGSLHGPACKPTSINTDGFELTIPLMKARIQLVACPVLGHMAAPCPACMPTVRDSLEVGRLCLASL